MNQQTPASLTDEKVPGCPFNHTDFSANAEIYEHYDWIEQAREQGRFAFNDTTEKGFWMVQRYPDVVEAFQNSEAFTNDVTSALNTTRSKTTRLLPQELNGEDHVKLRRVINPFFAPAAVRRVSEQATQRCIELIEDLKPTGQCDFVQEFAIRFPTDIFLAMLGLPVEDGDFFLPWTETLFASFFGGDAEAAAVARENILEYFSQAVNERRRNPLDPKEDLVSRLIEARIDDEPISHDDILTVCMTLMLAGLDTTRSALGYIFAHLARNDADRQFLIDNPDKGPAAVEEFIRLYPLVIQAGRYVAEDTDFNGLSLTKGDILWLGIGSANRDPDKFPDPDKFILDRPGVHQHIGFGAGPHRCLGMHLARHELVIALREWHERIPHYRIAEGATLPERGGQLTLTTLPLEWEV